MAWIMISTLIRCIFAAQIILFGAVMGGCASTTAISQNQYQEGAQTASASGISEPLQDSSCQSQVISVLERNDYENAIKELLPLAQQGDAKSQFMVGALYYEKPAASQDVKRVDYGKSEEWFKKSANQGLAEAQLALGWLYENGQGVSLDMLEASRWYRRAAKQGLSEAQYNLALLYHHGRGGVMHSEDLAEKWYLLAAEQGHACAQYNLGALYEFRTIILKVLADTTTYRRGDLLQGEYKKYERAYIDAYKWYAIAASNNLKRATKNRDKLEPQLTPAELAEAKKLAREWIDKHQQPR
jgi:hypothetical protein